MSKLAEALAKPTAPPVKPRRAKGELTTSVERSGDTLTAELQGPTVSQVDESAARALLIRKGENPDDWVATGYRSSEWTMANGELGVSNRYSFARVGTRAATLATEPKTIPLDDLLATVKRRKPKAVRAQGDHGFVVALGDMQFGKVDGDGVAGTLERTVAYLDKARDLLDTYRQRYDIGHVHVAWLGDHIEGFVSQGGANVARTQLSLNEQIRLTRRVMLHALDLFAHSAEKVTMVAVPGNHGETVRFAGKGITRYDASHDTESLIAVADAAGLNAKAYGHVKFYVPTTDELTVTTSVAGTLISHAHGHSWRPGKHFDWWEGQAFGESPLASADLLLAGHLHHQYVESNGKRLFVQVPALESESTWFRHSRGVAGNPGILAMITKDGVVPSIEVIQ